MTRILVVGGSGNIGRQVVARLQGRDVKIRVLSRNPERAGFPASVEVAQGDLTSAESVSRSLEQVDAVFLVWTAPEATAAAVIERTARSARRIVFLSSPHNVDHPMFQKPQPNPVSALHRNIEELIRASGMEWTFVRPGMLASNALLWWAPQIRNGDTIGWPYLAAETAPTDERDIAAVAVEALCGDGHAGAEYVVTGPESLTQYEQLSTIANAIGRDLRIKEVSPEQTKKDVFGGAPPFIGDMLMTALSAAVGQPALVTRTVEQITASRARTFAEWAADHAHEFRRMAGQSGAA